MKWSYETGIKWLKFLNIDITRCWKRLGTTGTLIHSWWKCRMEQPQWYSSMVQPLWKTVLISHEVTRWPWNPSQVFNLEKWKLSFHKTCSSLLMQFYSESPQTGYNPHVILGYWVNKWKHPCREYYSATKRNKWLIYATTLINIKMLCSLKGTSYKGCILCDSIYMAFSRTQHWGCQFWWLRR